MATKAPDSPLGYYAFVHWPLLRRHGAVAALAFSILWYQSGHGAKQLTDWSKKRLQRVLGEGAVRVDNAVEALSSLGLVQYRAGRRSAIFTLPTEAVVNSIMEGLAGTAKDQENKILESKNLEIKDQENKIQEIKDQENKDQENGACNKKRSLKGRDLECEEDRNGNEGASAPTPAQADPDPTQQDPEPVDAAPEAPAPRRGRSRKGIPQPPSSPDEVADFLREHAARMASRGDSTLMAVEPAGYAGVFWEFYEANGWVDSRGQPVRSWKQKLITWLKHDAARGTLAGRAAGMDTRHMTMAQIHQMNEAYAQGRGGRVIENEAPSRVDALLGM